MSNFVEIRDKDNVLLGHLPIDLGWLDTAVARELRMLAVGVNPSLDLNFAKQEYRHYDGADGLVSHPLTPFVDFTRSTTATYFDANGVLRTAGVNEPRIDYDPVSGECKGLLIEESRTNAILYSEDMSISSWTKTNVSIPADITKAPDGSMCKKVVESTDATAVYHFVEQPFLVSPSVQFAASVYLRPAGRSKARLTLGRSAVVTDSGASTFDLTGSGAISNSTNSLATIKYIGDGWYRCSITAQTNEVVSNRFLTIHLCNDAGTNLYTGDGTSGIYIWGAQLEAGSFPTSYIKTEASAVTRGADLASVVGSNFSSWYRGDAGAILSEAYFSNKVAFSTVFQISDGTSNNRLRRMQWSDGSSRAFNVLVAGVDQCNMVGVGVIGKQRSACAYMVNDFAVCDDGGNVQTDIAGSIPVVNKLDIGSTGSVYYTNGHISRLTYWPKRLTNTQLQELSK